MNINTFIGLINNAALLLALTILYDTFPHSKKHRRWTYEILTGVLLGLIGVAIMLTPWRFSQGVIFDTRSVLLSMTGLFLGVIPTILAVLMTLVLRLWQGGEGVVMGVSVILTSAGLGLLWRYYLNLKNKTPRWFEFYGFGIVVHLAMLLATVLLPRAIILEVLRNIWLPVLLIYPLGTVLLGLLLTRQRQRRLWEQELREERDLLARISETSPVGIVTTDSAGQIKYANARAEEILGLSRDKIARLTYNAPEWKITDLDGGSFPEELLPFRQVQDTRKTVMNILHGIEWPDGHRVFLSINATPLFNTIGQIDGMVASIEDITERKKVEEALRENEAQLRLIIDTVPALIAYINAEHRYLYVNQAYADWYGYTKEEIVGKHAREILSEASYQGAVSNIEAVLKGQKVSFENVSYDINGHMRAVRAVYVPQQDENGAVKAFLALVEDITDRKRAEEQIQNDLKEKEILLREIHHRVKNNLQVIISLIRLQARSVKDVVALKAFQDSINRIYSMSQVHEQLYASNNFANIPFKNYAEKLANFLVNSYDKSSLISLNLDIQNVALPLDAAIPCGLLLNELLTNSLKYAFPDNRKGVIKISMRLIKDTNYELVFEDNGIGLGVHTEESETESFGMKLIKMLTEQINGKMVMTGKEGTCYKLTFAKAEK